MRGRHHRVHGEVRGARVPAPAVHHHPEGDAARRHGPVPVGDHPGRQRRRVLGQDVVGPPAPPVEAVGEHRPGPLQRLLGRLPGHDEGAAPGPGRPREQQGRARRRGQVQIVPAGVRRLPVGGVRQSGRLPDRQGVEFGPQQDGGPVPVAQHTGHTVPADAARGRVPGRLQPCGEAVRRAPLLPRQLGVAVQFQVEGRQIAQVRAESGKWRRGRFGGVAGHGAMIGRRAGGGHGRALTRRDRGVSAVRGVR